MGIPTGENLIPIPIPMGMGIPMGIPIPTATLTLIIRSIISNKYSNIRYIRFSPSLDHHVVGLRKKFQNPCITRGYNMSVHHPYLQEKHIEISSSDCSH